MTDLNNAEQIMKEIFGNSFVHIQTVTNLKIRHVYLNQEANMQQCENLDKHYRVLLSSRTNKEDEKDIGKRSKVVILICEWEENKNPHCPKQVDSAKKLKHTNESLIELVKDIEKIPDGDVDRWLIIDEIKKIIKEIKE